MSVSKTFIPFASSQTPLIISKYLILRHETSSLKISDSATVKVLVGLFVCFIKQALLQWSVTGLQCPQLFPWWRRRSSSAQRVSRNALCFEEERKMATSNNPRKFSEKIALHNQKQAEETAAFEEVMKDLSITRAARVRVSERMRVSRLNARIAQLLCRI